MKRKHITFSGPYGENINLFGVIGIPGPKKTFSVPHFIGEPISEYILRESTDPENVLPLFEQIIKHDTVAGKSHLVHHFLVSASVAVRMYLEGILHQSDLMNGKNTKDTLEIPNVKIGNRLYLIIVKSDDVFGEPQYIDSMSADGKSV